MSYRLPPLFSISRYRLWLNQGRRVFTLRRQARSIRPLLFVLSLATVSHAAGALTSHNWVDGVSGDLSVDGNWSAGTAPNLTDSISTAEELNFQMTTNNVDVNNDLSSATIHRISQLEGSTRHVNLTGNDFIMADNGSTQAAISVADANLVIRPTITYNGSQGLLLAHTDNDDAVNQFQFYGGIAGDGDIILDYESDAPLDRFRLRTGANFPTNGDVIIRDGAMAVYDDAMADPFTGNATIYLGEAGGMDDVVLFFSRGGSFDNDITVSSGTGERRIDTRVMSSTNGSQNTTVNSDIILHKDLVIELSATKARILRLTGDISGSGGLILERGNSSGDFIQLGGNNSYTGKTEVLGSIELRISSLNAIGDTSPVILNGTSQNLHLREAHDETVGSIEGTSETSRVTLHSASKLRVGMNNLDKSFAGYVDESNPVSTKVHKVGTGKWTLTSSTGQWTAPIDVDGGELEVASGADLSSVSRITVNSGGSLKANGTVGPVTLNGGTLTAITDSALTVNANSTIDLSGESSITFADSSGLTWSGSLSVNGTLGATSLRFGTDANGLTAAQLDSININGKSAQLDSNGYLVAIPELNITSSTYTLTGNDAIDDGMHVLIHDGTLRTLDYNETLGPIDLISESTIDVGSGFGTLQFADSSSLDWDANVLRIQGSVRSQTLRFGTDSNGLTMVQQSLLRVNGNQRARLDENGYLYVLPDRHDEFQVVGYLPPWRIDIIGATNFDYYDSCTRIVYFGFRPDISPNVGEIRFNSAAQPINAWNLSVNEFNAQRQAEIMAMKKAVPSMWLEAGIVGNDEFIAPLSTAELRTTFANNIIDLLLRYGFDGVNLDWEFPETETEKENYRLFVIELKSLLGPYGFTLTAAHHNWNNLDTGNSPTAYDVIDDIYGMAYDGAPYNSPMSLYLDYIDDFLNNHGVDPERYINGVAFYGRPILPRTDPAYHSSKTYRDIVANALSPVTIPTDTTADLDIGGTSYTYSFDSRDLIKEKVNKALDDGLGGIMIWEIGQDIYDSQEDSLMDAIDDALRDYVPPPTPTTLIYTENPQFDLGLDSWAVGKAAPANMTATLDTGSVFAGNEPNSVELEVTALQGSPARGHLRFQQIFYAPTDGSYQLTFNARVPTGSPNLSFDAGIQDMDNGFVGPVSSVILTDSPQELTVGPTSLSAGAKARLVFFMGDQAIGTRVLIDNAHVSSPIGNYTMTLCTEAGGSVGANPFQGSYSPDSSVILTATPDAGYVFAGWTGDITGTTNPVSFNINDHTQVTATFASLRTYEGKSINDLGYLADFTADDDNDGTANGLESFFGTDLGTSTSSPLMWLETTPTNDRLSMFYEQSAAGSNTAAFVEWTDQLGSNWSTQGVRLDPRPDIGPDIMEAWVSLSPEAPQQGFMRLHAEE